VIALSVLLVFAVGFLIGGLISAALGGLAFVLVRRDAKRRRHGWAIFGVATGLLFLCALVVVHSRPATVNLPHSIDAKNLFLNSIAYGSSLGVAAAIACVVTLLIPRPNKDNIS
jgi:hypothetical protein